MTGSPLTKLLFVIVIAGCGGKVVASTGAGHAGSVGNGFGGSTTSDLPPIGTAGGFTTGIGGSDIGGQGGAFIGVAGAFNGTGGTSMTSGGLIDACGNAVTLVEPTGPTICNFEGSLQILDVPPSGILDTAPLGGWFAYNDGTPGAIQEPPPDVITAPTLLVPPRGTSLSGIHTYGKGFGSVAGNAFGGGIGFSFVGPAMAVDPSATYAGITFFAKGLGSIKVEVLTTHVVPEFCECGATGGCYDAHEMVIALSQDWQPFFVRWNMLHQEGWGYQVAFDPRAIRGINFASNGPIDWDFWIDDISFQMYSLN